jgi:prevent-host-death family protein
MTKVIPALTARTQLGQIIKQARERGDRFIVEKRNEPQVVILSIEDYLANVVKQPKALTKLQEQAKKRGLEKLTATDIDREIRRIRKELNRER